MTFFQFIKSKLFLWQLLIALVVAILLISLVMWSLKFYTQHGRTIMVPKYAGFTENEIKESIANAGLDYVVIDSIFKKDALPGVIVDQIPNEGSFVKKGRKIFLTINAYSREMVTMPQLVDYSLRNAQVVLETSGLVCGSVVYKPSEYTDLVLGQLVDGRQIKPGTSIPKGTTVSLIVGSGLGNNTAVVPDIVGLNLDDVRSTMENVPFNLGAVLYDKTVVTSADSTAAIVYRQSPEAKQGATEVQGSSINIWLTLNMDLVVAAMAASYDE